jgi:dTDP-4-dehydrorhamnose reductase
MKKIWIVGGRGLLGSTLSTLCTSKNLDHISTASDQVDIRQLDQINQFVKDHPFTHIINCVAYTDLEKAEVDPDTAFQINAIGPESLARVAKQIGAKLIHISTDYVMGGRTDRPFAEHEATGDHLLNVYAKTKWEGEVRAQQVDPSVCIIRTSWLFGKTGKNFISSLLGWMQQHTSLKVVVDQINRPTFALDLSNAILSVLDQSGLFHFANSGEASRYEIAQKMKSLAEKLSIPLACKQIIPVTSDQFPTRAKRPAYSSLCTKKIEQVLGAPPRSWELALQEFLHGV